MKLSITLTTAIALATTLPCYADSVTVTGGDGFENGVLIDGTQAGTFHNDDSATGPDGSAITVGPYDAGPGEAIAYTTGHAPTPEAMASNSALSRSKKTRSRQLSPSQSFQGRE